MRFLVYADVQATDGNERLFSDPNLSLQHWRITKFFDALRKIYDEYACDGLIDLGDTTDDRSAIPVPTIDSLLSCLNTFPDGAHYKLIGNHEQFLRDTTVHVGKLFDRKFEVIPEMEVLTADSTVLLFCSYSPNEVEIIRWIDQQTSAHRLSKTILFGHFQVAGCLMNSGTAPTGVPIQLLNRVGLVLLGHVHKPQTLGQNTHYVGSPFQQNFGESGEQKRVAVVDTNTLKVIWVSMSTNGFPEYRTVNLESFIAAMDQPGEDRYKVLLKSPEESEVFYSHPHWNHAEPVYDYDVLETQVDAEDSALQNWSFDSVLQRYLKHAPPNNFNIPVPPEEMFEIGVQIARDEP